MPLKKALIMVEKGSGSPERIEVMFNPDQYAITNENQYNWDKIPGMNQPIAYFISGEVPTLTMDLFFDTYEKGTDVRTYTQKITKTLEIDNDTHVPPLCKFVWGSLTFKGVVTKVDQKFTMFLDTGIPVRAALNVTFKEVASVKEQLQEIPRQSADRTKQRTVKQGDQLWRIAADEYDDPSRWREIARANSIDDPNSLEPGSILKIPRLY